MFSFWLLLKSQLLYPPVFFRCQINPYIRVDCSHPVIHAHRISHMSWLFLFTLSLWCRLFADLLHVFIKPLCHRQNATQDLFLRGMLLVSILSFPSSRPVAQTVLLFSDSQMSFPRTLAQKEIQAVSSRIRTWLAESISYYDNRYTMFASLHFILCDSRIELTTTR